MVFFAGFLPLAAYAQKDTALLSTETKDASLAAFIGELEKQTGFRFYFDTTRFDSITISVNARGLSLTRLLNQAFAGKGIYYTIDEANHVFITRGKVLTIGLPAGFFDRRRQQDASGAADNEVAASGNEDNQPVTAASLENKLYEIGSRTSVSAQPVVTVAGYVKDAATGEPVVGASVYVEKTRTGVSTDQYGYYSLSLPKGRYVLNVQSIGMKDSRRQFMLYTDGKMNIDLQSTVLTLKRVIISAQKLNNVKGTQMGLQKIDIKTIKQVPVVFGEADVLRVVTTLPGVKTVGEASTGLNVRGGSADQNLIFFNDATIYNPSHFFGMFSAFNPEVVKDVELYKSSIPARYGGRLSSVLNINSREGNKKNITGSAGIGLLTSRLNVEGPLIKDKSSFILGGGQPMPTGC